MSLFDSIRALVDRREQGETAYILITDNSLGVSALRFLNVEKVHFHDHNGLLEYREEQAVQFFHVLDCRHITVHFVTDKLEDYLKRDLPALWDSVDASLKEAMLTGHPFVSTK